MTDPLEERLRRLRAAALPDEIQARLATPPPRSGGARRIIIGLSFAAAAAAAAVALLLRSDPPPTAEAPVFADTNTQRVEDVRPLAVLAEGRRAWELVEVKWVDETRLASTAGQPVAVQASNTHRTIVPVEIMLD